MSTCLSHTIAEPLASNYSCNLGFYCANNSNLHPPEYCQPTVQCQIQRFQLLDNICSEAQGDYEPAVCRPGFYCPPPGQQQLPCPSGSFCPVGSYQPWPCDALSYCPAGSSRQFSLLGLVLLALIDLAMLIAASWPLWKHRLRRHRKTPEVLIDEVESIHLEEGAREPSASTQGTELAAFVASVRYRVGDLHVGLHFEFKSLSLLLPKSNKYLLKDVTCSIGSGQVWAIMGPSGAGKSTFVNVLTGKMKPTSGAFLTNGISCHNQRFKELIGYVPQDDIILSELTVKENLLHSARIRLPHTWTTRRVNDHVNVLIRCLGLWEVRNNLVGDVIRPRISGGQRKRVSIGIELAAAPMGLVLDEPTSGLDATSALSIIELLRALSRLGVAVVCIIHQPRTEIFEAIDQLMLLSQGHQVYVGPAVEAVPYFESLHFELPFRCNPADVIIDIIAGQGIKYLQAGDVTIHAASTESIINAWRSTSPKTTTAGISNVDSSIISSAFSTSVAEVELSAQRGASWLAQLQLCFVRSLRQQRRQTLSFVLEITVAAIAGLLIGLSVLRVNGHLFQGTYVGVFAVLSSASNLTLVPELGLLCSLAIGLAAAAPGVKIFGEEKSLYWREASSGHSRSAYYVGKVVSTIFRMALSALHFTTFYAILATPLMGFGLLYTANLLYFFCIYGLASCVSVVARREDGPLLAMIVSLIIGVLGGYGPSLSTIKIWHLEWFWRLCPGTWFSEAFFYEHTKSLDHLYDLQQASYWTGYSIDQPGVGCAVLLVIGLFYRIVACGGLVGSNRKKQ